MTKRSEKYNKSLAPSVSIEKGLITGMENREAFSIGNLDSDIYHRKYNITAIDNLIQYSQYPELCLNIRMESAVGNGFNAEENPDKNQIATAQEIIDFTPIQELRKIEADILRSGEYYSEIIIFNRKPLREYHISFRTMTIGKSGKYKDKFIQYCGLDKEKILEPFDVDLYKAGKLKDGHYIYHEKIGSQIYGIPEWYSAKTILETVKEQNRVALKFFTNDAIPDFFTTFFNCDTVNDESAKAFKKSIEEEFQGSDKRFKTMNIFYPGNEKTDGLAVKLDMIEKKIMSKENLDLALRYKFDIVALFRVPHFLVGLNKPGELGNGGQAEILFSFFIQNVTQPAQRRYYEKYNMLFPDLPCQLNTMQMPKAEQVNNEVSINIEEKTEKKVEEVVKKAMNENRILTKFERDYYEVEQD